MRADPGRLELLDREGQPVELTAGDFRLLEVFLESPGRVLSRDAILDRLDRQTPEASHLLVLLEAARRGHHVILTTDHGSKLCRKAVQIRGNKDTSSNVRYKFGDNLGVEDEKIFLMKNPEDYQLPAQTTIENYAITSDNTYLVYPTNFHEYERLYRDSFQHGGISLEEMICPFVVMQPR